MIKVVGDIGSCHGGTLEGCLEAVDIAKSAGIDIIKFQLFQQDETSYKDNIAFPREYWKETVEYAGKAGIDIFASVFDEEAIDLLKDTGIKKAKLAYSQNFNLKLIKKLKENNFEIWASGDGMNYPSYADIKLYCISDYPVKPFVSIHPECLSITNKYFNGFSSHIMGYKEDLRIMEQMTNFIYLEKHFHINKKVDCPDYWISLSPKELKELSKGIIERNYRYV